mgnify:CR=1 FL=1
MDYAFRPRIIGFWFRVSIGGKRSLCGGQEKEESCFGFLSEVSYFSRATTRAHILSRRFILQKKETRKIAVLGAGATGPIAQAPAAKMAPVGEVKRFNFGASGFLIRGASIPRRQNWHLRIKSK